MSRTGYAKLSNEFWRSPSVMEMLDTNPAALGYYVAAVSYASDNLTDGLIEERVAKHSLHVPEDIISFLVEIGKWEAVESGWLIHNYAKWQNSREQIEAARERDRNRKTNDRSEDIPDGIRTESRRNPDGIRKHSRRNPKTLQTESSQQLTKTQNQNTITKMIHLAMNQIPPKPPTAMPTPTRPSSKRSGRHTRARRTSGRRGRRGRRR